MLGRSQETTISPPPQTVSFARPISAEAEKVREVLLAKGLETPPDPISLWVPKQQGKDIGAYVHTSVYRNAVFTHLHYVYIYI